VRFPVSRGLFAAATLCAAISFVEAAPTDCVEDSSDGRALKSCDTPFLSFGQATGALSRTGNARG